jgi:hypothetical protein
MFQDASVSLHVVYGLARLEITGNNQQNYGPQPKMGGLACQG